MTYRQPIDIWIYIYIKKIDKEIEDGWLKDDKW